METPDPPRPAQRDEDIFPADAGEQQHRAADGGQQNGRAAVRFNKNQPEHQRDDQHAGQNHAASPSVHLPLETVAIPREHDDQRELGKFGRLKAHAVEIEPAVRAVDFSADVAARAPARAKSGPEEKIGQANFFSS